MQLFASKYKNLCKYSSWFFNLQGQLKTYIINFSYKLSILIILTRNQIQLIDLVCYCNVSNFWIMCETTCNIIVVMAYMVTNQHVKSTVMRPTLFQWLINNTAKLYLFWNYFPQMPSLALNCTFWIDSTNHFYLLFFC